MEAVCRHCGQPHEAFVTLCPVTGGRLGSATYTLVNDDEVLVGSMVGERYRLREILGQGSTGTVFATVHAHFERAAAMKVLRPRYVSLDTAQRVFHAEARAAFSVSHPSLVEVFDIGTLPDGAPFFVMERLDGDTLAARLGRERFSVAAAVDLMMQLLSAMEAVHARELLVRDLRPQNIFLAQRHGCRPVLKLLDLGLSRMIPLERVEAEWDSLRAVVGANESTGALSIPYYLSPERTRGEHGVEPSSDIFVAASIFYEALTGQKAFHGASWAALLAHIAQAQPTALAVLRPDVPEELAELVMRALSGKPRARPATARAMQDELRSVFESPRRGSASSRTAPASAADGALAPSSSERERGDLRTPFVGLPPPLPPPARAAPLSDPRMPPASPAPDPRAATTTIDALDEEQTSIEQRHLDVTVAARVSAAIDEASADHPIRTERPPRAPEVDIPIDVDEVDQDEPPTARGDDLAAPMGSGLPSAQHGEDAEDDEDQTETMELTPELRARIDQMAQAPAGRPRRAEPAGPPPTRRPAKPPR
jgi:eukaryotic-like serine/threonine-protein kinase